MNEPPLDWSLFCCLRLRRRKNRTIASSAIINAPAPITPAATIPPFTLFLDFPESSSTTDVVPVAPGEAGTALGSLVICVVDGAILFKSASVVVVAVDDVLDELDVVVDDNVTGLNVILVYTTCINKSAGWPINVSAIVVACSVFPHAHCE